MNALGNMVLFGSLKNGSIFTLNGFHCQKIDFDSGIDLNSNQILSVSADRYVSIEPLDKVQQIVNYMFANNVHVSPIEIWQSAEELGFTLNIDELISCLYYLQFDI